MMRIVDFIKKPYKLILFLAYRGWLNKLNDEIYLKLLFRGRMGKKLNLDYPETFNEKLQWLKLNDRKSIYTTMVDKYKVREYIANTIGKKYLIPLIGVWDKPDEIDFDKLPEQFVIKCNHNSGKGMYICTDKSCMDKSLVKKALQEGLKENYYLSGREWPYMNVERKIIAEKFLCDGNKYGLTDYKFFCFDGYVHSVMCCIDRFKEPKFYFFDRNWKLLKLNIRGREAPDGFTLPKPDKIDEMFEIASKLSKGIAFLRVDLYYCNERIYFGEMTFFPDSGLDSNLLEETDKEFGKLIKI